MIASLLCVLTTNSKKRLVPFNDFSTIQLTQHSFRGVTKPGTSHNLFKVNADLTLKSHQTLPHALSLISSLKIHASNQPKTM